MSSGTVLLAARGVRVRRGHVPVLRGIDLELRAGRLTVILGPNGAGKSTLLLALSGAVRLAGGRVLLEGRRVDGLAAERLVRLGIAHVPQRRHLFAELSVRENLELARFARRDGGVRRPVSAILGTFPLLARQRDTPAGLLSGGQQQLLVLARALCTSPRVLLCDEPTAALGGAARTDVLAILRGLADAGAAVAVVEQDVDPILPLADDVVVMRGGVLVGVRDAA